MDYRLLGRAGVEVSPLALGTVEQLESQLSAAEVTLSPELATAARRR